MAKILKKYPGLYQNYVSIDYDMGHFPFLTCFGGGSGIRFAPFKGGYWELRSACFPSYSALDTVLGLVKAFEDAEANGMVVNGHITEERHSKAITISKRGFCEFCGTPLCQDSCRLLSVILC